MYAKHLLLKNGSLFDKKKQKPMGTVRYEHFFIEIGIKHILNAWLLFHVVMTI